MSDSSLSAKLKSLPSKPGVYIFRNSNGDVIYVGKAKSLKNRVRSYFQGDAGADGKGKALRSEINDLEINVCGSEVEALILEATLIKRYTPRYNIILRDDKSYPYIEITMSEMFPRARLVRGKRIRGNRYYGPYVNARAARNTIRLLEKIFPLRQCRGGNPGEKGRTPCLYYEMKSCSGPCVGKISHERYMDIVDSFCAFLEGKHRELIGELESKMKESAAVQDFEEAARIRNQVRAADDILRHYMPKASSLDDYDIIGMKTDLSTVCFSVARNRNGVHIGTFCFFSRLEDEMDEEQLVTEFIKRYYGDAAFIPGTVYVPVEIKVGPALPDWLSKRKGAAVRLKYPLRGARKKELELAGINAEYAIEGMKKARSMDKEKVETGLSELKEKLGLRRYPIRIECYDISTMGGTASVGSMVVFQEGFPVKREYRKFKIKYVAGVDDVGMMKEVLYRRFKRYMNETGDNEVAQKSRESKRFSGYPDLILLDGGKPQLGAGMEVLKVLGIEDVDIAALAKKHEEIFQPGKKEPIQLPNNSEGLFLLQRIRDEAHNAAVSYNRLLMNKATSDSWLDEIAGIGPGRKKNLIKHFGSPGKVKTATYEELMEVSGLPARAAEAIFRYTHNSGVSDG